jgi:hypothetical protein
LCYSNINEIPLLEMGKKRIVPVYTTKRSSWSKDEKVLVAQPAG